MTLVEFLLARIAEDEWWARKASPGQWKRWGGSVHAVPLGDGRDVANFPEVADTYFRDERGQPKTWDADHVARWDPVRVLAECEAKRRIVETASSRRYGQGGYGTGRLIMQHMATVYASHPDYRAPSDDRFPVWDDDPVHDLA